jgi:hypothetical protein
VSENRLVNGDGNLLALDAGGYRPMKYLLLLFALMIIGISFLAPKEMQLLPDQPYVGAYSANQ